MTHERLKALEASDEHAVRRRISGRRSREPNLLGVRGRPEPHGGSGLGFVALVILLLQEVGRTVAPVPAYIHRWCWRALPLSALRDPTSRSSGVASRGLIAGDRHACSRPPSPSPDSSDPLEPFRRSRRARRRRLSDAERAPRATVPYGARQAARILVAGEGSPMHRSSAVFLRRPGIGRRLGARRSPPDEPPSPRAGSTSPGSGCSESEDVLGGRRAAQWLVEIVRWVIDRALLSQ